MSIGLVPFITACLFFWGGQLPRVRSSSPFPLITLGTPSCKLGDTACVHGTGMEVSNAIAAGFAAVDTANHYHNQEGVRAGLRGRRNVFVQTKVEACNNSYIRLGSCYEDTLAIAAQNFRELGLASVDLLLLHAPTSTGAGPDNVYPGPDFGNRPTNCSDQAACGAMREQWRGLIDLYRNGSAKSIGVSNYCPSCLDCIRGMGVEPAVNQLQLFAGMNGPDPAKAVSLNRNRGIIVQAYSPLGSGSSELLNNGVLKGVAQSHGVSTAQVALRWLVQHEIPLVVRAGPNQTEFMKEDLELSFNLTAAEMETLDGLKLSEKGGGSSPYKAMCL